MVISKNEFKKAFSKVVLFSGGISVETELVQFKAKDGTAWLTCVDGSNVGKASIRVEGDEELEFVVPILKLRPALSMRGKDLTFKKSDNSLIVSDTRSRLNIALEDADKFPNVSVLENHENGILLNRSTFVDALAKVSYVADPIANREFSRGVNFSSNNGGFNLQATEPRRASKYEQVGEFDEMEFLLTEKGLKAIGLFDSDSIELSSSGLTYTIKSDNYIIHCTGLSVEYPNTEAFYDVADNTTEFTLTVPEVIESLKLFSGIDTDALTFKGGDDKLHLSATVSDNSLDDYIGCSITKGESFEFQISKKFINDLFKNTDSQELTFIFIDYNQRIGVTDNNGVMSVIMPITD